VKHVAFLALGSNIGDRLAHLRAAIQALEPEVNPTECSPVYETPPWGYTDQPKFLNQVVMAETDLSPADLLIYLKDIEEGLGREKSFLYGPRLIDLDILFYDHQVINSPPLTIPHPRMHDRGFVLMPLNDLAPDFEHPVLGVCVHELLADLDTLEIDLYSPGGCGEQNE